VINFFDEVIIHFVPNLKSIFDIVFEEMIIRFVESLKSIFDIVFDEVIFDEMNNAPLL
jgi:hypothetical protein